MKSKKFILRAANKKVNVNINRLLVLWEQGEEENNNEWF